MHPFLSEGELDEHQENHPPMSELPVGNHPPMAELPVESIGIDSKDLIEDAKTSRPGAWIRCRRKNSCYYYFLTLFRSGSSSIIHFVHTIHTYTRLVCIHNFCLKNKIESRLCSYINLYFLQFLVISHYSIYTFYRYTYIIYKIFYLEAEIWMFYIEFIFSYTVFRAKCTLQRDYIKSFRLKIRIFCLIFFFFLLYSYINLDFLQFH